MQASVPYRSAALCSVQSVYIISYVLSSCAIQGHCFSPLPRATLPFPCPPQHPLTSQPLPLFPILSSSPFFPFLQHLFISYPLPVFHYSLPISLFLSLLLLLFPSIPLSLSHSLILPLQLPYLSVPLPSPPSLPSIPLHISPFPSSPYSLPLLSSTFPPFPSPAILYSLPSPFLPLTHVSLPSIHLPFHILT